MQFYNFIYDLLDFFVQFRLSFVPELIYNAFISIGLSVYYFLFKLGYFLPEFLLVAWYIDRTFICSSESMRIIQYLVQDFTFN